MIVPINKESLFHSFDVVSFSMIHSVFDNMAPSLVEYYLSDLCDYSNINDIQNNFYFNPKNIQEVIHFNEYSLYFDYNEEVFLEINISNEDHDTEPRLGFFDI